MTDRTRVSIIVRMRTLLLSCGVLIASAVASAQRPELAGTWTAATGQTPSTLPAAPSPVFGARLALAFDGASVVITRPLGDLSIVSSVRLDGSRTSTAVPGRLCEGERTLHETAAWEGDALVVTVVGSTPAGGGETIAANNRTLFRLEAPDRIVVEGTMVQQGQRRQVGGVYQRSTETLPSPRAPHAVAGVRASIAQVAWIGTVWTGTSDAITTEERWTPPASGGMMATARTLRGSALASFEFLCIAERSGSLAYLAMPNGRTPATVFMATEVTPTSITFENPAHDFPKLIRYAQTPDGGLETTIAGAAGAREQKVSLRKAVP